MTSRTITLPYYAQTWSVYDVIVLIDVQRSRLEISNHNLLNQMFVN